MLENSESMTESWKRIPSRCRRVGREFRVDDGELEENSEPMTESWKRIPSRCRRVEDGSHCDPSNYISLTLQTILKILLKMNTTNNIIKKYAEEILAIPPQLTNFWNVADKYYEDIIDPSLAYDSRLVEERIEDGEVKWREPVLALIHYMDTMDPSNPAHEPLLDLRGVVIALREGVVVASSNGFTDTINIDSPLQIRSDQLVLTLDKKIYMNDQTAAPEAIPKRERMEQTFDLDRVKLFAGYKGVFIRFFKWNGIIFFSSHRRINALNSRYNNNTRYIDIFNRLKDTFEPTDLFGEEEYSPFCYTFMLVDDAFRLDTTTLDNRLVYLDCIECWDSNLVNDPDSTFYSEDGVQPEIREPRFTSVEIPTFDLERDRPPVYQPQVSVKTANKILFPKKFAKHTDEGYEGAMTYEYEYGDLKEVYYRSGDNPVNDRRTDGGDFVFMYIQSDETELVISEGKVIEEAVIENGRIVKPAVIEGGKVLSAPTTDKLRVIKIFSPAYTYRNRVINEEDNYYYTYVSKSRLVASKEGLSFLSKYPQYMSDLRIAQNRLLDWQEILYYCVPPLPEIREKVNLFYDRYLNDIEALINLIGKEFAQMSAEEMNFLKDNRIVGNIVMNIFRRLNNSTRKLKGEKRRKELRFQLNKLTGDDLYKLIKSKNYYYKVMPFEGK